MLHDTMVSVAREQYADRLRDAAREQLLASAQPRTERMSVLRTLSRYLPREWRVARRTAAPVFSAAQACCAAC